jgi:hypothetical protein
MRYAIAQRCSLPEKVMRIDIIREARFAVRGLRRSPGLSAAIISTLALGIGIKASIARFYAVSSDRFACAGR